MKKQSLLSIFITIILLLSSLNAEALESKQEITNSIFSDPELSKLLSIRPFESAQGQKATKRLKEMFLGNIQKFSDENFSSDARAAIAECLSVFTLMNVISTPAFEQKLAKPEQLISDYTIGLYAMGCLKSPFKESPKFSPLSVNDLLLDFTAYYGKEVVVNGYIVYNDMGSYLFHSKGNMNAVFLNNDRLSRESKKYLMGCGAGCEVTLKVRPSQEDSILMKTAYVLSVVK